ncbi:SDR family NAD(P)-dependent oxidoreductase [Eubacterium sp. MSJ-13]|uniref:SDR family NAD(P)-dependent oxidoreductase n=1 Tax=Eubacterium sp. MSJ-13 TaxID=2841513 RepID=UPI001C0F9682|nr:SDR family NAD(P)-dependent oxidoreductase [Eubacterium sp. MSJ-13]MBU5477664.1 SDR family NAD(P)-dependent oxidoreductase [Eubacterium sp. MSJ-13]
MKYALITGGTSGIGFAMAGEFLERGYGVIIASSSRKNLAIAKRKLEVKKSKIVNNTRYIITIEQDLSVPDGAQKLYHKAKSIGVDIEILVNNAGFGLMGGTESIRIRDDKRMIQLNVTAVVCLCKLFLRDMYENGRGKILNVASTGAFQPGPYTSTYFAGKSFVYSYSRAIRQEAAKRGVVVSTLCPGTTRTKFFEKAGQKTPIWAMSAEKTAKIAVDGLMKNKGVIVPGVINNILRIVPSGVKMYFVEILKK